MADGEGKAIAATTVAHTIMRSNSEVAIRAVCVRNVPINLPDGSFDYFELPV